MPGGFHPPLSVILSWPEPNYTDPAARGHQLLAVTVTFGLLAIIFVAARLWSRIKIQKNAGLDDLFISLALIPTIGITSLFILVSVKFRWFRHIWDVPFASITGRQYHSWVVQMLFVFSTFFSKVSTLLLYRRIMSGSPEQLSINIVNSAIVMMILYWVVFVLLMALQCRPTASYWLQYSFPHAYTEPYTCMFEGKVPMANAIISVTTDFMIGLLPIYLFWHLRVPIREKIVLGILFGVAFLVCIMGIVRTVLIHRIFYETYDVSWYSHDLWIWTNMENDLLIVCSSVPPLRALFKRYLRPHQSPPSPDSLQFAKFKGSPNRCKGLSEAMKGFAGKGGIELNDSVYGNFTTIHSEGLHTPDVDSRTSLESRATYQCPSQSGMKAVSVVVDYQRRTDTVYRIA